MMVYCSKSIKFCDQPQNTGATENFNSSKKKIYLYSEFWKPLTLHTIKFVTFLSIAQINNRNKEHTVFSRLDGHARIFFNFFLRCRNIREWGPEICAQCGFPRNSDFRPLDFRAGNFRTVNFDKVNFRAVNLRAVMISAHSIPHTARRSPYSFGSAFVFGSVHLILKNLSERTFRMDSSKSGYLSNRECPSTLKSRV